jgi:hypothetical protein
MLELCGMYALHIFHSWKATRRNRGVFLNDSALVHSLRLLLSPSPSQIALKNRIHTQNVVEIVLYNKTDDVDSAITGVDGRHPSDAHVPGPLIAGVCAIAAWPLPRTMR